MWGQGGGGDEGYEDHGGSELSYEGGQLLGALEDRGESLAAHSESGDVDISPEEWISFFNTFSRQHDGWLASIKVPQGKEQQGWEVKERPLVRISSDHLSAHDEIYITIDGDQGGNLTHGLRIRGKLFFDGISKALTKASISSLRMQRLLAFAFAPRRARRHSMEFPGSSPPQHIR